MSYSVISVTQVPNTGFQLTTLVLSSNYRVAFGRRAERDGKNI